MDGRTFTHPSRDAEKTAAIYGGEAVAQRDLAGLFGPTPLPETPWRLLWGEIHGHTELSDGVGSLDDYFRAAREEARLDFCAVTDHDHGGVGRPELWGEKWEHTQAKVAEYHDPPRFTTLLGYERDSWPWYANLCLYYRNGRGDMVRGERDGHITRDELAALLARDDVLALPHHTANIGQGVTFDAIPPELMTPLIEVYSKWGASEYFGNPQPLAEEARGGHWRDALERGARMGCLGGSDVHSPHPGLPHDSGGNIAWPQPGLVAVWAVDNTREAVFDALRARRCYAASGARIEIDLRVAGAVMGEEVTLAADAERRIQLTVRAEAPLASVEVVKNGRDQFAYRPRAETATWQLDVTDLTPERATDYYYVRVTQTDERRAWSSPVWVTTMEI